jgi:hypothetical protein
MSKRDKIKNLVSKRLKEMSATGTGASFTPGAGENYATPTAFNPNKKADGTAHNYYYKLGFKPVNKKALNKAAKGIEVKQLWKEGEETTPEFDVESFIASLPTDDEKLKEYVAGRLGDFNLLSGKLKELITLIRDAKKETIASYKQNPQYRAVYGTDLAVSLVDNLIKLFKK